MLFCTEPRSQGPGGQDVKIVVWRELSATLCDYQAVRVSTECYVVTDSQPGTVITNHQTGTNKWEILAGCDLPTQT